jgi:hypothetical protein
MLELVQVLGASVLPSLQPVAEELLSGTDQHKQRAAAELIAAMIGGGFCKTPADESPYNFCRFETLAIWRSGNPLAVDIFDVAKNAREQRQDRHPPDLDYFLGSTYSLNLVISY